MTDADYEDDNENDYEPQNTRKHRLEWLEAEKEAFATLRDVNGDGFLDLVEVMLDRVHNFSEIKSVSKHYV